LARWAILLQEYQPFEIVHFPGKSNIEADFLSRLVGTITFDYSEQDDVFYRRQEKPEDFASDGQGRWRFVGDGNSQLVVPRGQRKKVLRALHGHMGTDRVVNMTRKRFFWPNIAKDIRKYCRECHPCAVGKDSPIKNM